MKVGGGSHCGAIRFEAEIAPPVELLDCNCSACSVTGFHHLIVPHSQFELTSEEGSLTSYRFGTGQAEHLFCRICGVKSFYQPRSHPDCWSVNFHCLDDVSSIECTVATFDGRDWERAHASLHGERGDHGPATD